jgi:hypothetical protein
MKNNKLQVNISTVPVTSNWRFRIMCKKYFRRINIKFYTIWTKFLTGAVGVSFIYGLVSFLFEVNAS